MDRKQFFQKPQVMYLFTRGRLNRLMRTTLLYFSFAGFIALALSACQQDDLASFEPTTKVVPDVVTSNYLGNLLDDSTDVEDSIVTNYPNPIDDYVTEHYPGDSIIEVEFEDSTFEVSLASGLELLFDQNGAFISMEVDDEITDYPAAIDTYLKENYPDIGISEVEWEDGTFEVELENGVELIFDDLGNLLEVEPPDGDEDEDEGED